jgi:hypothetical protein
VTPLQTVAWLAARQASPQQLRIVRSLAAREDLRVDTFWEDLTAPELWAERDSLASLDWSDVDSDDARSFRRALFLIAEDLELRGLGTDQTRAWLERLRPYAP